MTLPDRAVPDRGFRLSWLAVALALVAVGFVLATFVATRAADVDASLDNLRTNALPSVSHLLSAKAALHDLDVATEALATASPSERAARLDAALRERARVETEVDEYAATPWYAGEEALYIGKLHPALHALDDAFVRIVSDVDAGPPEIDQAASAFRSAVGPLDLAIADLARLNESEAEVAASRMEQERTRSLHIASGLGSAAALLGILAAVLAVRAGRRHESVLARNAELLRERADELQAFAERVAHDLLSPLSSVWFVLDGIATQGDGPAKRLALRGKTAVDRSRRLVEAIFDFARSGAKPSPSARVTLSQGMEDLGQALGDDDGAVEVVVMPFEDCEIRCDRGALYSILSNLTSNARKYVRDSVEKKVTVRTRVRTDRVRIEVADTGPGIRPDLLESIFEPYVRGPDSVQPGVGLGLATVKRFAIAFGGDVGVDSTPAGSTFWVELPRVQDPSHAAAGEPVSRIGLAKRLAPRATKPEGSPRQKATTADDVKVS
jgi:signal transduction histidine kinase